MPETANSPVTIREFRSSDFPEVRSIYQQGIDTGHATFQSSAKSWQEWDCSLLAACRLVAEKDGRVTGWAALAPVSDRPVYSGVAEVSVYVGEGARDSGIGSALLRELIRCSESHGIWTLQAGIFPENESSIALHAREGFRTVGVREKLGQMKGRWRDVVLLERRSQVVGAWHSERTDTRHR